MYLYFIITVFFQNIVTVHCIQKINDTFCKKEYLSFEPIFNPISFHWTASLTLLWIDGGDMTPAIEKSDKSRWLGVKIIRFHFVNHRTAP
jgi:hypothetical protein